MRFGEKISGGGDVSSFETGGGIGMGGPLALGGGGALLCCTPEWLSYIHQNHQKPITLVKEGDVENSTNSLHRSPSEGRPLFSEQMNLCTWALAKVAEYPTL